MLWHAMFVTCGPSIRPTWKRSFDWPTEITTATLLRYLSTYLVLTTHFSAWHFSFFTCHLIQPCHPSENVLLPMFLACMQHALLPPEWEWGILTIFLMVWLFECCGGTTMNVICAGMRKATNARWGIFDVCFETTLPFGSSSDRFSRNVTVNETTAATSQNVILIPLWFRVRLRIATSRGLDYRLLFDKHSILKHMLTMW